MLHVPLFFRPSAVMNKFLQLSLKAVRSDVVVIVAEKSEYLFDWFIRCNRPKRFHLI